jgi:hypothetical protein
MKNLTYLLLFSVMLAACGRVQDPEFRRLEGFGVKNVGFTESTVTFNATFYNPNNFGVAVKEAAFDVYIEKAYLGKFTQPREVSVGDKAEFSIPMEGRISFGDAVKLNVPGMIGKEVGIRAVGNVRVGKAGVFINKDFTYEGRQKITADLIKNPAGAGLQ